MHRSLIFPRFSLISASGFSFEAFGEQPGLDSIPALSLRLVPLEQSRLIQQFCLVPIGTLAPVGQAIRLHGDARGIVISPGPHLLGLTLLISIYSYSVWRR